MECKSGFLFYLGLRKIEHDLGECIFSLILVLSIYLHIVSLLAAGFSLSWGMFMENRVVVRDSATLGVFPK